MTDIPFALDLIDVATPCHASWEGMSGDARVRHCASCQKNVYNLSAMTRPEAEALVHQHEGEMCVRFYRRADGTLLTADCPVGLLAAARRRLAGWFAAVAAGLLALATVGSAMTRGGKASLPGLQPMFGTRTPAVVGKRIFVRPVPPPGAVGQAMMGGACPLPPPSVQPQPAATVVPSVPAPAIE